MVKPKFNKGKTRRGTSQLKDVKNTGYKRKSKRNMKIRRRGGCNSTECILK